jgi:hypothetical protein
MSYRKHSGDPSLSTGRLRSSAVLVQRVIQCPVCERRARSFRITRVKDLRTVEGEFYHGKGICACSMMPSSAAAVDLLRLAIEEGLSPAPSLKVRT